MVGMVGTIRSWPRRVRDSIRQEGCWRSVVRACLAPFYQAVMITSQPLELEPFETPALVSVRPAGPADIEALVSLRREYSRSALESRLIAGHDCFLSIVKGQVVACRWGCTQEIVLGKPPLVLPLQEDEACVYEVFNHPRYRWGGIGHAAYHALKEELLKRNRSNLVGYVTPGRKPWGRDNQHRVATIRTLRLGPLRKFWVRTYGPQAEYWRERLKELRWA
jgi:GNAT superfamily N-acetyltransferase